MSLKLKIPPPVVALFCAVSMWWISQQGIGFTFEFAYQNVLAVMLLVIGLCIDFSALVKFKQAQTTVNPMRPEQSTELVTGGIYQYSRNPMYLGLLCILLALGIYFANLLSLIMVPFFIVYMTMFQIIPEEQVMEQRFGKPYLDYKRNVRRWI